MFIATLYVCAKSHVWVCKHVTYSISAHEFLLIQIVVVTSISFKDASISLLSIFMAILL